MSISSIAKLTNDQGVHLLTNHLKINKTMNITDIKMLIACASTDPTKVILQQVYCDGKHAYSTNGHIAYRCEFVHDVEPFCVNVKYLRSIPKPTKKKPGVTIDPAAKVEMLYGRYPDIQLLFPGKISPYTLHTIDIPHACSTQIINAVALWDLPLVAIKFEDKKVSILHGIGGRWLRDTIDVDVIDPFRRFLPTFTFACEYLRLMGDRLYVWDKIEYMDKSGAKCFVNSKTKSTYLVMETDIRKECKPFEG
jgi:hypothetical protein